MLKEELIRCSIPLDDAVAVIKESYPGFDKPLLSKACNQDKYGIQLIKGGLVAVAASFPAFDTKAAIEKKTRKFLHRLTCRVSCRLEDDDYAAFLNKLSGDGVTAQDWLTEQIHNYLADSILPNMKG